MLFIQRLQKEPPPFAEHVQTLFRKQEKSHQKALQEEKKLLKLLRANGLTPSDIQRLIDKAFAAIEAESWRPEEVSKEKIEPTLAKEEAMDKTKTIKTLEDTIMLSVLAASKSISDGWASVTEEDPMPWKSNFVVRSEILWFFLHMMARYAFDVSPEARAILQDELVPATIQRFITTSFDSSNVKRGFDSKGWETGMANEALEELNEAEMDYSSCKTLGIENEGDFAREETVLGKLAARINNLIEHGYNIELRLLIWMTAVECLAKSGLKEQVKELIDRGEV